MRPSQARFVTTCQQLLALAVVCAALTPAAAVVSLDVVRDAPSGAHPGRQAPVVALSAYAREEHRSSVLPAGPVEAQVDEYPLTAAAGRQTSTAGESSPSRAPLGVVTRPVGHAGSVLVSRPERVQGYGSVGITWDRGATPPGADLAFEARLLTDGTWSSWIEIPYDAEHAPDPGTAEARHARPGTDILLVGKVDQVQVRSTSSKAQPDGMSLAVVAPGHPDATEKAPAAIQATPDGATTTTGSTAGTSRRATASARTRVTPEPTIYSRAQWGANERMRDRSSLHYYEVHAGFVHHTVNANDYTRREVPGIIRSIYAYHVQSRGWSDIGYNFLVDKFGRVWEGRYGGVDRPVVGAHTLDYNDYSFAMSAIGNYETARPRDVMLQAYGSLYAWKLSLHGVDAGSTDQLVGSTHFQAINGHRDAAATACPGRHLYAKLPTIRRYAEAAQRDWSGRDLRSDVAGAPYPDLLVRRASDGKAFVIPTGGLLGFDKTRVTPDVWAGRDLVIGSPDLTGDGVGDLVSRSADTGRAVVRPGTADGYGTGIRPTDALAGRDLVTAAGDLNGDGDNDLVARNAESGMANVYLGGGNGSLNRRGTTTDLSSYDLLAGAGDVDSDGNADLVARDSSGHLWLLRGTGTRTLGDAVALPGQWGRYDSISGLADYTRDGKADLLVRVRDGAAYVLGGHGDGTFGRRHGPYDRLAAGGRLTGVGNVLGTGSPDVVARRGDDLLTFQNNGHRDLGTPIATGLDLSGADRLLNVGDWDRDGHNDIVTRRTSDGDLFVRLGDGRGGFGEPVRIGEGFGKVRLLASVGDMTGDGFPDLMGQPRQGSMRIYPGRGLHAIGVGYVAHSAISAGQQIGLGRWDQDGAPDSLFRQGDRLVWFRGNGPGGLMTPRAVTAKIRRYDWIVGVSDLTGTGRSDLLVRTRAGDLYALRSTSKGFGAPRFLGGGMGRYDLVG